MNGLALRSIGAFTAGGATAPQTMASIHARFQLFGDSQVKGADGEPLTVAATPLNKASKDARRLAELGSLALTEAFAGAPEVGQMPLVVCAPSAVDLGCSEAELLDRLLADGAIPIERARVGSSRAARRRSSRRSISSPSCFVPEARRGAIFWASTA